MFQQTYAIAICSFLSSSLAWAVSCPVAPPHITSEAESAFFHSDYNHAAELYAQALQAKPNDPDLTAGLLDVLLKQEKVADADSLIQKAIAAHPESPILQTALGFVQYRQGAPQLAATTAAKAMALNPCYPRLHLLNMQIWRLNSMFKAAAGELRTAHLLDPSDPEIRVHWMNTLPLQQRISELEAYLASPHGQTPDDLRRMRLYLDSLKKSAAQPHKSCQLVSSDVSTEIKFAPIMRDGTHVRAFGLDVKLNDHSARLEIDTGASGLLISRSVAKQAGLEAFAAMEMGGVGSAGEKTGYSAYVDSIKIGKLEFHDCAVDVLDSRDVVGNDGLIGMDVFSNLLVTLDYPMHRLDLSPLPPRPSDTVASKPSLETSGTEAAAAAEQKPGAGPQDRYVAPGMADWTRVYRLGHNLILPAALNESKIKLFIMDTGAFTTSISPEAAREVTKLRSEDSLTIKGISGKVEKVYAADHVTFRFANLRQTADGAIAFDTSNISKHLGTEISGFIGITTLQQLTVRIDYRDALVKFEYDPNRGYRPR